MGFFVGLAVGGLSGYLVGSGGIEIKRKGNPEVPKKQLLHLLE